MAQPSAYKSYVPDIEGIKESMINFIFAAALAVCSSQSQQRPLALTGLDPVQLVHGKKVVGSAHYAKGYGKFTYRFASSADQSIFESEPARYAVQRNGECLHMPGMPGDPSLFLVVAGKIYLVATEDCYAAVKDSPASFVNPPKAKHSVAILLFPGAEIIDYAGPWEVFGESGFDVFTVAAKSGPIHASMGQTIVPDYTFENCPKAEILLLPGGAVQRLPRTDPTSKWIRMKAENSTYTMSVCNGAFWLADAGLLDGKSATTIRHSLSRLAKEFPKVTVVSDQRYVDNGSLITTAGLSAGIDGAFHMVERILGASSAREIARGMEYDWREARR